MYSTLQKHFQTLDEGKEFAEISVLQDSFSNTDNKDNFESLWLPDFFQTYNEWVLKFPEIAVSLDTTGTLN